MPLCVQELHQRGLEFPVLIGGAAINRDFGRRIALPAAARSPTRSTSPASSTARTPSQGLDTMDALVDEDGARGAGRRRSATRRRSCARSRRWSTTRRRSPTTRVRSAARTDDADPRAAVLGRARDRRRPRRGLPLPRPPRALQAALGRARREGRGVAAARRGRRRATRASRRGSSACGASRTTCTRARGSATSPATPTATSWSIFDPEDRERELERLVFPRQPKHDRICLADFFRPARLRASATSSRCRA